MANFFDFMSGNTSPIDVPAPTATDTGFFKSLLDSAVGLVSERQVLSTQEELARIRAGANTPVVTQGTISATVTAPAPSFIDNLPPLAIPIVLGILGFVAFRMGFFK